MYVYAYTVVVSKLYTELSGHMYTLNSEAAAFGVGLHLAVAYQTNL